MYTNMNVPLGRGFRLRADLHCNRLMPTCSKALNAVDVVIYIIPVVILLIPFFTPSNHHHKGIWMTQVYSQWISHPVCLLPVSTYLPFHLPISLPGLPWDLRAPLTLFPHTEEMCNACLILMSHENFCLLISQRHPCCNEIQVNVRCHRDASMWEGWAH